MSKAHPGHPSNQQPPDQPYMQPEMYQWPQQPVPPPRTPQRPGPDHGGFIAVVLIIAVIVAIALYSSHYNSSSTSTQSTTDQSTGVDQSASQSSDIPPGGIGVTEQSGSWSITVNSINVVVSNNDAEVPKAGDQYININVTALNTDTAVHQMNPLDFTLRDDSGTQYDWQGLSIEHTIFATVIGGQKIRGDVTYEVPKSAHIFTLQYDSPDDTYHAEVVQWSLSI